MGLKIKIISLILGIVFVLIILKYSKKNLIRPAYTLLWLIIALFLISIPILETFYQYIAHVIFGFSDATNIIYTGIIFFLLAYQFYVTVKINKLSDQVQILISHTAIIEKEIKSPRESRNRR